MKRRKQYLGSRTAFALLAAALVLIGSSSLAEAQGTRIEVTVTATSHLTRTFNWTIDKSVTPATWNLFRGDSGTSRYTIEVTKDAGTQRAFVTGRVCVKNTGTVDTQGLAIQLELRNGESPPNDLIATFNVALGGNPNVPAGQEICYDYEIDIPSGHIHPGGVYRVTANVTITNHSGPMGTVGTATRSANTNFNLPSSETLVHDTIHVDDTNGLTFLFRSTGSASYTRTFTCDADGGTHNNTATIRETGQSDSASVTVNCYALEVSKTAETSLTRTYRWTIDKWAGQSSLTLAVGEPLSVNYSVRLDATSTDSDWAVSGTISIRNPAPIPATINGVSDVVSSTITASVQGASFPTTIDAGRTLQLTYTASLPDGSSRTNTATATLQNHGYDPLGSATLTGTTDFSGSASVNFSSATINEVDESVAVNDTLAGALGTVTARQAPKSYGYAHTLQFSECGEFHPENTATFETNDTSTTGTDTWTIAVRVPCVGGCTLSQGYWRNHSKYGKHPHGGTGWGNEETTFFNTGKTWYQALREGFSNPHYSTLARQYIAAYLNIMHGADGSALGDALNRAEELLRKYRGNERSIPQEDRQQFTSIADRLDQFNNGQIGPGRCSE